MAWWSCRSAKPTICSIITAQIKCIYQLLFAVTADKRKKPACKKMQADAVFCSDVHTRQGVTENASISVIVGDFQRMELYAQKGWQLPRRISEEAWEAFRQLVAMGYDRQLAK